MKILLLGATGRTGKHVLSNALELGYEVTCLARNTDRLTPREGLHVIEGSPLIINDLEKALIGCDAVINVLNISRSTDFPWAPLRTPPTFLSDVMNRLIVTMNQKDVKRLIVCSAWGVAETRKDIPFWFRWIIENSNIGVAYKDHERQEKLVIHSNLDWTIVRPVGLTNFKKLDTLQVSFENKPKPNLMLSRKSLAYFMVKSISQKELIGNKAVVSNP